MFLLFLVVAGVVALVIVKIINPNKKAIEDAANAVTPSVNITDLANTVTQGRKLMTVMLYGSAQADSS